MLTYEGGYLFVQSSRTCRPASLESQKRAHVQRDHWRKRRAHSSKQLEYSNSSLSVAQGIRGFDNRMVHMIQDISATLASHAPFLSQSDLERLLEICENESLRYSEFKLTAP
jgi:hypothetical protein